MLLTICKAGAMKSKGKLKTNKTIHKDTENPVIVIAPEMAKDRDFVKVFKLMTMTVLKDLGGGKIHGAADTLWWILDQLQGDIGTNMVIIRPDDVGPTIGKSEMQVRRHIKLLLRLGYIEKGQIKHLYKVNPDFVFRGSLKTRCQMEGF